MEFHDVVRSRRMVRSFSARPIPEDALRRILEAARRAPSAGFAQGVDLVVLSEADDLASFWELVDPRGRKRSEGRGAPTSIVIPVSDKDAYLRRYSEPDKAGLGMGSAESWPVAYWDLDAAMAAMCLLLAAVDEGLGGWFFGIFQGERELVEWLGIPQGCRPIGAVALGYPDPAEKPSGSGVTRSRRTYGQQVHLGGW